MGEDTTLVKEYLITGWDFSKAGEASCEIKNLLKTVYLKEYILWNIH